MTHQKPQQSTTSTNTARDRFLIASATPTTTNHDKNHGYKINFAVLWGASGANYLAYWAMQLALLLFAHHLTQSPVLISYITFALIAPTLVFGLFAGALVDRYDRRRILLVNTLLRLLTFGLALLVTLLGDFTLAPLYAIALVLGVTQTLEDPTFAATMPMIVPHDRLDHANAWLSGAQNIIEVITLPLGGFLASVGIAFTMGFGEGCAVGAFIALLLLRGSFRASRPIKRRLFAEVFDGLHYLRKQRILLAIGLMAGVINACYEACLVTLVLYAVAPGAMKLTPVAYSLLLTGGGIGSIVGALLTLPVQRWLGRRWTIGINILCNGAIFLVPALTTNVWIIGAVLFIGSAGGPLWTITANSFLALTVPTELQGRVNAAYRFLGTGFAALGPILGGITTQFFGFHITFLWCAGLTLLTLLPFFLMVTEARFKPTTTLRAE
ncbi:MAG TPA: MFS transporter [Ktedonobacteraceae bacterium]|nr:MFS transporter [Ktedonobacteraceae bacterium]